MWNKVRQVCGRYVYFMMGVLIGVLIMTTFVEVSNYCWKYSEVQQREDYYFGFDRNGENFEIVVTLPDSCGGSVEKAIETPFNKQDICGTDWFEGLD